MVFKAWLINKLNEGLTLELLERLIYQDETFCEPMLSMTFFNFFLFEFSTIQVC